MPDFANTALFSNGKNSSIIGPTGGALAFAGPNLTVEGWFAVKAAGNIATGLVAKLTNNNGWQLYLDPAGIIGVGMGTGTMNYMGGSQNSFDDGAWHHLAVTTTATQRLQYLDGVVVFTQNISHATVFTSNSSPLVILCDAVGGLPAYGFVSEVRIWNVARTSGQINALMQSRAVGNETGLVACYGFGEGSGSSAADRCGGPSLTLTNTAWVDSVSPPIAPYIIGGGYQGGASAGDINNALASWLDASDGASKNSFDKLNAQRLIDLAGQIGTDGVTVQAKLGTLLVELDLTKNGLAGDLAILSGQTAPPGGYTGTTLAALSAALAAARSAIIADIDQRAIETQNASSTAHTALNAHITDATAEIIAAMPGGEEEPPPVDLQPVLDALTALETVLIAHVTTKAEDVTDDVNAYTLERVGELQTAVSAARTAIITAIGQLLLDLVADHVRLETALTDTVTDTVGAAQIEARESRDAILSQITTTQASVNQNIDGAQLEIVSLVNERSDTLDGAVAGVTTDVENKIELSETATALTITNARDNLRAHVSAEHVITRNDINGWTSGIAGAILAAIATGTAITTTVSATVTVVANTAQTALEKITDVFAIVESLVSIINDIKDMLEGEPGQTGPLTLVGSTTFTSMIDWDQPADVYEIDITEYPAVRSRVDLGGDYYIPRAAWCAFKVGGRYMRGVPIEFTRQTVVHSNRLVSGLLLFPRAGTEGAIRAYSYSAP